MYAHVSGLKEHARARAWLDERLNDTPRVGLPWPSLLTFVRLVSNPRVFQRAERVTDAWRQVERWLSVETVWIPQPSVRHAEVIRRLLGEVGEKSDLVPDAHLASLALEHGLKLCSSDGDFARFSGLSWENPLA